MAQKMSFYNYFNLLLEFVETVQEVMKLVYYTNRQTTKGIE